MMVLSRLVSRENIEHIIPVSFSLILDGRNEIDREELIEECRNDIYRMLFDKNNMKAYWKLFEEIYILISEKPNSSVKELYSLLDKTKLQKVPHLTFRSAMFFISLIKDGLKK